MKWRKIRALRLEAERKIEQGRGALAGLREICHHLHKSQGLYSWRVGVVEPAIICDDCGGLIEIISSQQNTMISEQEVQASVASKADSSTGDGKQIKQ